MGHIQGRVDVVGRKALVQAYDALIRRVVNAFIWYILVTLLDELVSSYIRSGSVLNGKVSDPPLGYKGSSIIL